MNTPQSSWQLNILFVLSGLVLVQSCGPTSNQKGLFEASNNHEIQSMSKGNDTIEFRSRPCATEAWNTASRPHFTPMACLDNEGIMYANGLTWFNQHLKPFECQILGIRAKHIHTQQWTPTSYSEINRAPKFHPNLFFETHWQSAPGFYSMFDAFDYLPQGDTVDWGKVFTFPFAVALTNSDWEIKRLEWVFQSWGFGGDYHAITSYRSPPHFIEGTRHHVLQSEDVMEVSPLQSQFNGIAVLSQFASQGASELSNQISQLARMIYFLEWDRTNALASGNTQVNGGQTFFNNLSFYSEHGCMAYSILDIDQCILSHQSQLQPLSDTFAELYEKGCIAVLP